MVLMWQSATKESSNKGQRQEGDKNPVHVLLVYEFYSHLQSFCRMTAAQRAAEDNIEDAKGSLTSLTPCVFFFCCFSFLFFFQVSHTIVCLHLFTSANPPSFKDECLGRWIDNPSLFHVCFLFDKLILLKWQGWTCSWESQNICGTPWAYCPLRHCFSSSSCTYCLK